MQRTITIVVNLDLPRDERLSPAMAEALTLYASALTERSTDFQPFEQCYLQSGALITSIGAE